MKEPFWYDKWKLMAALVPIITMLIGFGSAYGMQYSAGLFNDVQIKDLQDWRVSHEDLSRKYIEVLIRTNETTLNIDHRLKNIEDLIRKYAIKNINN